MISFRSSIVCDRCIDSSFIDSLLEFCDNNIEFDEDVIIKDSNGVLRNYNNKFLLDKFIIKNGDKIEVIANCKTSEKAQYIGNGFISILKCESLDSNDIYDNSFGMCKYLVDSISFNSHNLMEYLNDLKVLLDKNPQLLDSEMSKSLSNVSNDLIDSSNLLNSIDVNKNVKKTSF